MTIQDECGCSDESILSTKAPNAKRVFVVGTFNNWDPDSHPLTHMGDGHWVLTIDLPPGRYEYKFMVDGKWSCESGCDEPYKGCPACIANQFGTMNRVLIVEDIAEQMSQQSQLA